MKQEISDALMKKRRQMEIMASFGLILILAGLAVPFLAMENGFLQLAMRWVYTLGAVLYTVARMVNVNAPGDSFKLRRARRMEMWGGICFLTGAGLWFYNAQRFGIYEFSLAVVQNTVAFTMAGAVIQMVGSWLVAWQKKKESK